MWVTTKVTYDGHPERKTLSIKRMVKGLFRGLMYLCLLLGIAVAVYQLIAGGIIPEGPPYR